MPKHDLVGADAGPPRKRRKTQRNPGKPRNAAISVVKQKLATALRLEGPLRTAFVLEVDRLVVTFARLAHEASVLSNLVVATALDDKEARWGVPVPDHQFYCDCIRALHGATTRNALVNHVYATRWTPTGHNYAEAVKGFSTFGPVLAKEMATNASNHIYVHFHVRQWRFLCKLSDGDKEFAKRRKDAINGEKPYEGDDELVKEHRQLLNPGNESVGYGYLKANLDRALRYMKLMGAREAAVAKANAEYHEKYDKKPPDFCRARRFSYLPLRGYQRSMLTIDTNGLWQIFRKLSWTPLSASDFGNDQQRHWGLVLRYEAATRTKRPNYRMRTDGVQVCVEYWRDRPAAGGVARPDSVDLAEQVSGLFVETEVRQMRKLPDTVLGVDPGCHTLVTLYDGRGGYFAYGKKEHYESAGFNQARRQRDKWDKATDERTRAALNSLRDHSFLAQPASDMADAWRGRAAIEDVLWAHYGRKSFRNLRFKTFRRKQKAYDRLRRQIREWSGDSKAVLALGAANFSVSRKGTVSGPLKEMAQELAREFRVVYTDEFRSSLCCHKCGEKMVHPRKQVELADGKKVSREVFCIYRCEQCKRFRNRDRNASRNIRDFMLCRLTGARKRAPFERAKKDEKKKTTRFGAPSCASSERKGVTKHT